MTPKILQAMERKLYKIFKEVLEVVALIAACFAFAVYLSDADSRETTAQLQTLQLSELCQNLATTVDGNNVWNYQKPNTFDDWDKSNAELDKRIAFLNEICGNVPNFIPPSRVLKGSVPPKQVCKGNAIMTEDRLMLTCDEVVKKP